MVTNYFGRVLLFFSLVLLGSCIQQPSPIIISGQISNHSSESVFILNYSGDTIASVNPDQSGAFSIELNELKAGFYHLKYGTGRGAKTQLHLYPGENLKLSFDASNFNESVSFDGDGSDRNNYLALELKPEFDWYTNFYTKLPKEERDRKGALQLYFKNNYTDPLREKVEAIVDESFRKIIHQNLDFELARRILLDRYAYETAPDLHPDLIDALQSARSLSINDSELMNSSLPYLSLIAFRLFEEETLSKEHIIEVYKTIGSEGLKNHFISELILALQKQLQYGADKFQKAGALQAFLKQESLDRGETILTLYQKFHEAEGRLASFSYPDAHGQMVSLDQFRGNYVYIDFWASWCGPCIKEFPDLTKVKAEYADKGITFLGISIDKSSRAQEWKDMIVDRSLPGIQLHAPMDGYIDRDEINDDFLKLMYVNSWYIGIPQFALIDPEGKVLDAFTYRPSNGKLRELFDGVLESKGE